MHSLYEATTFKLALKGPFCLWINGVGQRRVVSVAPVLSGPNSLQAQDQASKC